MGYLCIYSIWVTPYVGYPDIFAADQGPQSRSKYWKSAAKLAGINLKLSGVESHTAINVGEKYHDFLRRVFSKADSDHREVSHENLLSLSVKAVNDTAGPDGLVPTLLVFGVLPRIPMVPVELPALAERMKAMDAARSEMSKIVAKARLSLALKSNAPGAASTSGAVMIGSRVLVFREKPVNKWVGPFRVLDVNNKSCFVDTSRRQSQFSIDKVKLYRESERTASMGIEVTGKPDPPLDTDDAALPAQDSAMTHPVAPFPEVSNPFDDQEVVEEWNRPVLVGEEDDNVRDLQDMQISDKPTFDFGPEASSIHVTEVLPPNDPRGDSQEFEDAKRNEVIGIEKRAGWEVVKRKDVPMRANVLGGRFVLAYKNFCTAKQRCKARYVAQGNRDKEKNRVVHNVSTLRSSSTRLIASVAAVKGFRIFSDDVNQAYLQSKEELTREIFLLPKAKDRSIFRLSADEMLKLKKPIYGVPDAGDYWDVTVHGHVKGDLKLFPLVGDPSLYRKPNDEDIDGLMAVYDDDKAMCGNEGMRKITEISLKKFESKPREWDEFDFFGTHLRSLGSSAFSIDQASYIDCLKPIRMDCTFDQFRSHRAMFAWVGLTRPDMSCLINRAAQVTKKTFSVAKIREVNEVIKYMKGSVDRCLVFKKLDKASLHLRVYKDASFANNDDLSSQLGFVVLLCDDSNACHILDYSSKNLSSVCSRRGGLCFCRRIRSGLHHASRS